MAACLPSKQGEPVRIWPGALWLCGSMVKSPSCHGGNTSSILVRVALRLRCNRLHTCLPSRGSGIKTRQTLYGSVGEWLIRPAVYRKIAGSVSVPLRSEQNRCPLDIVLPARVALHTCPRGLWCLPAKEVVGKPARKFESSCVRYVTDTQRKAN